MDADLETWITAEIQQRGWSIRELARRGGVSHTAINNALAGSASLETYQAIARGIGVSLVQVLQHAGVIPEPPAPVPQEDAALRLFRQVAPAYRDLVLKVLKVFAEAPDQLNEMIRTIRPGQSIVVREVGGNAADILRLLGEILSPEQIERLVEMVLTFHDSLTEERREGRKAPVTTVRQ